jgi:hypothetical protein
VQFQVEVGAAWDAKVARRRTAKFIWDESFQNLISVEHFSVISNNSINNIRYD